MMKFAWNLVVDPEKLWLKVMKEKYNCGSHSLPKVSARSSCSNVWRAIAGIWQETKDGISWSLGNGNAMRFWKDKWIPGRNSLEELCLGNIPLYQAKFPVSFYVHDGIWK